MEKSHIHSSHGIGGGTKEGNNDNMKGNGTEIYYRVNGQIERTYVAGQSDASHS